jgi:ATP-dependent RNA helicase RhlE
MRFEDLNIIEPVLKAMKEEGYTEPTLIQEKAIPVILDRIDVLGSAQTGTGKTAAFAIPILQHLYNTKLDYHKPRKIRALVITPTRELAIQIADSFSTYGKYTGIQKHSYLRRR